MTQTLTKDRELEELVGRTVGGKYAVLRLIGRGGMGAVYEAENIAIGKRVALKFVDRAYAKDEQVISRFAREARAASSVESAHIVTVFDAGVEDGRPYLVMELLRGEDLGTRLRRMARIPANEALHIVAQVLRGLSRAHHAGIVHRDLKPDNIFLVHSAEGDPLFAKLVDFGVSKIQRIPGGTVPLALTGKGTVLGTPLYMSPEQAQASPDLDGRADLYAVGAILFECITGRPPHTGASYEQIILAICMTDAPNVRALDPSVPEPLAAFVARALARDRALRFQSAMEMLAALHEVAPEERVRVPLDSLHDTIASAPMRPIPVGGPPTDVSWSGGAKRAAAVPARSGGLPRILVPLTALTAMVAGVAVTLWIFAAMRKPSHLPDAKSAAAPSTSAEGSAHAAPVPASAHPPSPDTNTEPPAPSAAPSAAAPVARPSPTRAVPGPKPSSAPAVAPAPRPKGEPLDIARELP